MGTLVPEDYPLRQLRNDDERWVVDRLVDGLRDSWLVLPSVALHGRRDRELDVVLVHPDQGVVDVEVKGHRARVEGGLWRDAQGPLDPQPFAQAKGNAYALRDALRSLDPSLGRLRVEYALALPNVSGVEGSLGPEVDRAQVLTATDLADPTEALERLLLTRSWNQPLGADGVERIVGHLRPDADLRWDPEARARSARQRLDERCRQQVAVLAELDVNRRVVATGAAGTGKTRLAMTWARQAFQRGERTLLTCYNDPLGAWLRDRLADDPALRVGAFLRLALELEGMPPLDVPPDADHRWWTIEAVGHLHRCWPLVTERFDTIVVDEAQDFSPAWIAQLEALLDPDGPRRVLLAVDESQALYERGFVVPPAADGWTHCRLVTNCRNAWEIGTLLRRFLGGAPAPAYGPAAVGLRYVEVAGDDDTVAAVSAELARLDALGRDLGNVLVATTGSHGRDLLRERLGLGPADDRRPGSAACETVHRSKGLERDTVLLVATDHVTDELLYVGISRAISELVVIGTPEVGRRLRLAPDGT